MSTDAHTLVRPARIEPHDRAASLFQEEWPLYRKVVEENYFFHREAYATLHQLLCEEMGQPFRFVDVACGDANAATTALAGTAIAHYRGVDLSKAALALASEALRSLPCPVTLEHRDFVEALRDRAFTADVVWVGLSLHHLKTHEKRAVMSDIRLVVGEAGKFLVYENSGPDGDTREAWMMRWDRQRPAWTAFATREWDAITEHVHAHDHPETHVSWLTLGYEAGFGRARCLYESPTQLFRLYCFDS